MKKYTTPDQTAKLIELGFEMPKHTFTFKIIEHNDVKTDIDIPVSNYSIGELIEMLPTTIAHEIWWGKEKGMDGFWGLQMGTNGTDYMWTVDYVRDRSAPLYRWAGSELIDALFDAIITLKEEGVI